MVPAFEALSGKRVHRPSVESGGRSIPELLAHRTTPQQLGALLRVLVLANSQ